MIVLCEGDRDYSLSPLGCTFSAYLIFCPMRDNYPRFRKQHIGLLHGVRSSMSPEGKGSGPAG